jgi:hypothetical protein
MKKVAFSKWPLKLEVAISAHLEHVESCSTLGRHQPLRTGFVIG